MLKRVLIVAVLLTLVAGTASAQTPRIRITGLFGFTLSDGVSGEDVFIDGARYNRIDPTDGGNFGFSIGFMADEHTELGFMYRRQMSSVEISGPTDALNLADFNLDGYHGFVSYYFGDPEAKVNPYLTFGLGATSATSFTFTRPILGGEATASGGTQFSGILGTGIQFNIARNFALKGGVSWVPTYVKSDAAGYWCDPWYGCYIVGDSQYANQFHFEGGIVIRF
jgi:hypothetical protein